MKWYKIPVLLLIALLVYFCQEDASFHLIRVEKTPDERPAYNPQLSVITGMRKRAAISREVQFDCKCLFGSTCCPKPVGGYYCCPYIHAECCGYNFCCPVGTRCTGMGRCKKPDQPVRKQDNTTDVLSFRETYSSSVEELYCR